MVLLAVLAIALAHPGTVWTGCAHSPVVRMPTVVVACGDGNFYVTKLHWKSWSPDSAVATGIGSQNDCKPYCAAGHFRAYPISIRLSKPVTCVPGRREFARIAWRWMTAIPRLPGIARTGSETLPCRFLRLTP